MNKRVFPIISLIAAACLTQVLFVNCQNGFQSNVFDAKTQAVLNMSVFSSALPGAADPAAFEDLTTTENGVNQMQTDQVQIPVESNPSTPECSEHTPGLDALRDAIKTKAAAADQDVVTGELNGCEAGLVRFAAAAIDANGAVVKAKQIKGFAEARVGVYCPRKNFQKNGNAMDDLALLVRFFIKQGLRGKGIKATYLCKYQTPAAQCKPDSADFIGGLEYGQYGYKFRISNVAGINDANLNTESSQVVAKIFTPNGGAYSDLESCNKVALWSPLVIESITGGGIHTLNPYSTATYFDLTGTGVQNRISCVTGGAFLTLPDGSGRIVNINQLFGDNTVGPDGKKAANGFVALGKHDSTGDGLITSGDAVFPKLRLWQDSNCDGAAQLDEVARLSAWNISAINWRDYFEMMQIDAYGNQTRQRGIAYRADESVLRVFDLWFMAAYGSR